MARKINKRKGKGKRIYSIIVDGKTEIWYFQMMKRHENLPRIDIKPELPKRKALKSQYELVLENARDYYKVIWIVDFDTLIKEDKETKKGEASIIQKFNVYIKKLAQYDNVKVLVNTPCLEYWYLLHFEATTRYYAKCETAEKQLKKNYLPDYQKTEAYYKKQNNDIYKQLKPLQQRAILNAKNLGFFDVETPASAKAELYQMFGLF